MGYKLLISPLVGMLLFPQVLHALWSRVYEPANISPSCDITNTYFYSTLDIPHALFSYTQGVEQFPIFH